ncbi:single-stranded DNA-binding protein [Brevibacterium sp. UMB10442]|nr:single-stranded DNA-binding protein [Brevibacterium sp. UMB10442]
MKQLNYFVGTIGSEIRSGTTQENNPWTSFRVAVNYDRYDRDSREYKNVDTNWYEVMCYNTLASNVRASVNCGDSVIVIGRLRERTWTTDDGQTGSTMQILADAVGHNLQFHGARSLRPKKVANDESENEGSGWEEVTRKEPALVGAGGGSSEPLSGTPDGGAENNDPPF